MCSCGRIWFLCWVCLGSFGSVCWVSSTTAHMARDNGRASIYQIAWFLPGELLRHWEFQLLLRSRPLHCWGSHGSGSIPHFMIWLCSEAIALNGACLVPRLSQANYYQLYILFLYFKNTYSPGPLPGTTVCLVEKSYFDWWREARGNVGRPSCRLWWRWLEAMPLIKLITRSIWFIRRTTKKHRKPMSQ